MPPTLLYHVRVDSLHGDSSLRLWHGDISEVQADLLAVSTHANPTIPPTGAALSALSQRWGVDLRSVATEPLITPGYRLDGAEYAGTVGTHRLLLSPSQLAAIQPTREVLLVRIPDARRVEDPLDLYGTVLGSLMGSVAYLEVRGHVSECRSLAMPILGGSPERGFSADHILQRLLETSERLLQMTTSLRVLELVVFRKSDAESYVAALDRLFNPADSGDSHDASVRALKEELHQILGSPCFRSPGPRAAFADDLSAILKQDAPSLHRLGETGRKMAEFVVDACAQQLPGVAARVSEIKPRNRTLMSMLNAMDGTVAPWIIGHLHNLRTLGNEVVHYKSSKPYVPRDLTPHETLSLLVSVHRCALFWRDELAATRSDSNGAT